MRIELRDGLLRFGPAVAFLALGLASLDDYGRTHDEHESYQAGAAHLEIVRGWFRGEREFEWPWHELTGYQFVLDTLRSGFAEALPVRFADPIAPYHLFNLLMATTAVYLLGRIGTVATGRARVGALASAGLIGLPKFLAHSQNNPKDLAGLLGFVGVVLLLVMAQQKGRWRDFLLVGMTLGLALANQISCVSLLPIIAIWSLWSSSRSPVRRARELAVVYATGVASWVFFWPWLWPAPLTRAVELLRHLREFSFDDLSVLYLGEIFVCTELPWHYSSISLLLSVPAAWITLAALGAVLAARQGASGETRSLAFLAGIWCVTPLVTDLFAAAHYDGVRHVLGALPAVALLVALGAEWLLSLSRSFWQAGRRTAAMGIQLLLILALLSNVWQLAVQHPYADAFVNVVGRLSLPERRENFVELEYWGHAYKEGARWLIDNAPESAVIRVPVFHHAAWPYLHDHFERIPMNTAPPRGRPRYVMFITRRASYGETAWMMETGHTPVHTIRRQGAILLKIFSLPAR